MKNKVIFLIVTIVVVIFSVGLYIVLSDKKEEVEFTLEISDVSKNCISNQVNIYSNDRYQVLRAIGASVIKEGNLNYKKDYGKLLDKIKNYKSDDEHYINYRIVINGDTVIIASQKDATELNELIGLIPLDDPFWCS